MKNLNKSILVKPNVRQPCYRQRVVRLKTKRADRNKPSLSTWQEMWSDEKINNEDLNNDR